MTVRPSEREPDQPDLSCVVTAGPLRERTERVLSALDTQAGGASIEVLIVDHAADGKARAVRVTDGLAVSYIAASGLTTAAGRAEAVRRARGKVVALIEDHAYPAPGWVEAVISAHRGPWKAIGYVVTVANPDSWVSRAGSLTEYGRTMHPAPRREAARLPGHNVSYNREALLSLDGDLEWLLGNDLEMGRAFAEREMRMLIEPTAIVAHEFFSRIGHVAASNPVFGRVLGSSRARAWSRTRRWVWGLGTPLTAPIVRVSRILRELRRRHARELWRAVPGALPVLVVASTAGAIGEAIGYVAGPGNADTRLTHWELEVPRDRGRVARD